MKLLTIDIETNLAHDTIWGCAWTDGRNYGFVTTPAALTELLQHYTDIVGHNAIKFDYHVLSKVWDIDWSGLMLWDTMVMVGLYEPEQRQSLKLCCERHNSKWFKSEFDVEDFDGGLTDEMEKYAIYDVLATHELFVTMEEKLTFKGFSAESVMLEHGVAEVVAQQERNGFAFDMAAANQLYSELCHRNNIITTELQETFPPIVTERYSEKTGKRLKDHVEVFNPGSRQQIAKRLTSLGAKFTEYTEKNNIQVSEGVLDKIDLPEAQLVKEYLMIQKRTSMLDSWISKCSEDGRIRGRVRTNGALPGRMTHSNPNLAQIPAVRSPYGKECRSLFTVEEGNVLVGADASGLELRMLAHYMQDDEFTHAVVSGTEEEGTDAHTRNQRAFGAATRDVAKTLIYALMYGAGDTKLGLIVGGTATTGRRLRESFLKATPGYADLMHRVELMASKGSVKGLDGRRIWIRHAHAALNSLLQGAGAIIMKRALIIADEALKDAGIFYKFVANVHDEWQVETEPKYAQQVGHILTSAITQAGVYYNCRCPLDGSYKVGNNWAETH